MSEMLLGEIRFRQHNADTHTTSARGQLKMLSSK